MAKLEGQGLLDDSAFARLWTDNRESFSPRSRLLDPIELQKKGVAGDVIEAAVSDIDDEANAYRAAISQAAQLAAGQTTSSSAAVWAAICKGAGLPTT